MQKNESRLDFKCLTKEEQVALAKKVAMARWARERLAAGDFTAEERGELEKLVQEGQEAREKLAQANLPLVISIAKKFLHCGIPLEDLVQEGMVGLLRAIDRYDYKRGVKFSTYAYWWIRQAITRALPQARLIKPPVASTKVLRARATLQQTLGRDPLAEEIAAEVGVLPKTVKEVLRASQPLIPFDALPQDPPGPKRLEEVALAEELRERVEALLATLPAREALVLRLRFGLEGEPLSLRAIARMLGVTGERVRQLEAQALKRLRAHHDSP